MVVFVDNGVLDICFGHLFWAFRRVFSCVVYFVESRAFSWLFVIAVCLGVCLRDFSWFWVNIRGVWVFQRVSVNFL